MSHSPCISDAINISHTIYAAAYLASVDFLSSAVHTVHKTNKLSPITNYIPTYTVTLGISQTLFGIARTIRLSFF